MGSTGSAPPHRVPESTSLEAFHRASQAGGPTAWLALQRVSVEMQRAVTCMVNACMVRCNRERATDYHCAGRRLRRARSTSFMEARRRRKNKDSGPTTATRNLLISLSGAPGLARPTYGHPLGSQLAAQTAFGKLSFCRAALGQGVPEETQVTCA